MSQIPRHHCGASAEEPEHGARHPSHADRHKVGLAAGIAAGDELERVGPVRRRLPARVSPAGRSDPERFSLGVTELPGALRRSLEAGDPRRGRAAEGGRQPRRSPGTGFPGARPSCHCLPARRRTTGSKVKARPRPRARKGRLRSERSRTNGEGLTYVERSSLGERGRNSGLGLRLVLEVDPDKRPELADLGPFDRPF